MRWRNVDTLLRSRLKTAGILNGCGPKGGRLGALVPNRILRLSVEEFCDWHDLNYTIGGKEADRIKADWQFYTAIYQRAKELTSSFWLRWARPFYCFTAWCYYRAVRLGGAKHFYYGVPRDKNAILSLLEVEECKLNEQTL